MKLVMDAVNKECHDTLLNRRSRFYFVNSLSVCIDQSAPTESQCHPTTQ